jgi:hypothetical protein
MLLWLGGCEEPVIDEGIQPLTEPATVDATGGTWRTIVLQSAADITVPEPAAIASDSYQKELSEIKNGLLGVNPEQNTAVNYWATGGVHRWNQLARLLISKYNVDPLYSNPAAPVTTDGAFTSPPYAARLYALLSVAQYDALVVTWKAKYQYNRPSMSRQGINPDSGARRTIIPLRRCRHCRGIGADIDVFLSQRSSIHQDKSHRA